MLRGKLRMASGAANLETWRILSTISLVVLRGHGMVRLHQDFYVGHETELNQSLGFLDFGLGVLSIARNASSNLTPLRFRRGSRCRFFFGAGFLFTVTLSAPTVAHGARFYQSIL